MDYALALSSRLAEHGIHGRLIFYRWHIRGTETDGSHVFVFVSPPPITVSGSSITRFRIREKFPRCESNGPCLSFGDTKAAPVDVELQNGLNHLSFF